MRHSKVQVRFAPSPTGFLHLGGARTALFNYLFAKKNKGQFILRIEDTDSARSRKEFEEDIKSNLRWLGIKWDKIFYQSQRKKIYKKFLVKLVKEGKAFYCNHKKRNSEKGYSGPHFCSLRDEYKANLNHSERFIIRFKTPRSRDIVFDDIIRGKIKVNTETIGDFAIAKSLEEPLYNFAAAVDDWLMKISHIIRGEDHISNTPKQILLFEALNVKRYPLYAHLPLILGEDYSKMSKRHGDTALYVYRQKGFLREAIINFLALLGWNPKDNQELFSFKELEKKFNLEDVQKKGAVFNLDKLIWFNRSYIKRKTIKGLFNLTKDYFTKEYGSGWSYEFVLKVIEVERERSDTLLDIVKNSHYFFKLPAYSPDLLRWRNMDFDEVNNALEYAQNMISRLKEKKINSLELLKKKFLEEARLYNNDRGRLLWPLRVALSGLEASASPFEIVYVLGYNEALFRIKKALNMLKT